MPKLKHIKKVLMNTSRWEVQLLLPGQTQSARGSGAVWIPQPVIWNKTAVKNAKKKKLPDAKQDLGGDVGERIRPFSIDLKHLTH